MNQDPKLIARLEAALRKPSQATQTRSFPTWEEVQKRVAKYPDFDPKQGSVVSFDRSWKKTSFVTGALLAAATLSIVFLLGDAKNQSHPEEQSLAMAKAPVYVPLQSLSGILVQVKGKASLKGEETSLLPANKGKQVKSGDLIVSGPGSEIDIEFENQTWLRIFSSSQVEIQESGKSDSASKQTVRILQGKALFLIGKLKKDSEFRVTSGDLETQVRGTTFSVSYDGKSVQKVALREGSVSIQSPQGNVNLEPGKEFIRQTPAENGQIQSISATSDKELKALESQILQKRENALFDQYARLELVRLEDGTEYRGVIQGQTETHLLLETVEGTMEIPIKKILETEKIR
ncbi:sigma factor regulatory protein, FecR/PupR family [Leptospira ryugenii]|uniref:Sigma factor regulatory protein, FecR/PupR family n=1 Tax=Leptospira ryugenii TaxID=1917863 RepID=A0A2P2E559_9LEPT|nr:FecR family protein [Leptospira ryugenii]GBF52021.1 sigma factor regulatory protein, FecR/PupR family [Leptospira ryugenii]